VIEKLQDLGYYVVPVDARRVARDSLRYKNIREELWETAKEHFRKGTISIPNDTELIDQYANIRGVDFVAGRLKLPSKKQMKTSAQIGYSPDRADSVNLTYAVDDSIFRRNRGFEWMPKKEPEVPLFAKRSEFTGY
jgi:hypothetical protein